MSMCSGRLRGRSRNTVIPLYGIIRMDIYTIPRSVCVEYKKRNAARTSRTAIVPMGMASVTAKSRFGADVSDLSRQPGHHSDPLAGLLTPFRRRDHRPGRALAFEYADYGNFLPSSLYNAPAQFARGIFCKKEALRKEGPQRVKKLVFWAR